MSRYLPESLRTLTILTTPDTNPLLKEKTRLFRIRLYKSAEYVLAFSLAVLVLAPIQAYAQQDISQLQARVDELNIAGEYATAVNLLRPALNADPDNYILLCLLSDNITGRARHLDKKEQEPMYEEAVIFARRAVAADPADAEGHFQLGQALGRLALHRGGKEKVNMSKEIKEVFAMSLSLDARHPGSLHGLARWHREVANLSWALKAVAKIIFGGLPPASNEESVSLFLRALEVEPDNINHHLELGKTYLELDQDNMARQEFEAAGRLPAVFFEDAGYKEEAAELLRKIR